MGKPKQFVVGKDYAASLLFNNGRAKYRCVSIHWNRRTARFVSASRTDEPFSSRIAITKDGVETCQSDTMLRGRISADRRWK